MSSIGLPDFEKIVATSIFKNVKIVEIRKKSFQHQNVEKSQNVKKIKNPFKVVELVDFRGPRKFFSKMGLHRLLIEEKQHVEAKWRLLRLNPTGWSRIGPTISRAH